MKSFMDSEMLELVAVKSRSEDMLDFKWWSMRSWWICWLKEQIMVFCVFLGTFFLERVLSFFYFLEAV